MCDDDLNHMVPVRKQLEHIEWNEATNDEFIRSRSDPAVFLQCARDTCSLKTNLIGSLCAMIQMMKANSLD